MKRIIYIVMVVILVTTTTMAQTGTFDFTGASSISGGTTITQTVSSVQLTLTSNNGNSSSMILDASAGTYGIGMSGTAASMNGAYASTVTFSFSQSINIGSMRVADFAGPNNWNLHFLASNSSTVDMTIDGPNGSTVNFGTNFVGINSITVTRNGGGTFCLYIDNVVMDATLPVELTSFTALANNNSVTLNWATATEVNNYGFEVERASSLTTPVQGWEKIGFVNGNGNSNSPKSYSYTDNSPLGGNVQYRLKQIDFDGGYKYYGPVEATVSVAKFALNQNYPNPFNPVTHISYSLPEKAAVNLTVYDVLGRRVANLVNKEQESGVYNVEFNGSNLNSGIYFYELKAGRYSEVKKLLLVK